MINLMYTKCMKFNLPFNDCEVSNKKKKKENT